MACLTGKGPSDSQSYGPGFLARTYLVDRALRRLRPLRLLDIGCGRGNLTEIAARHIPEIVTTDVSADAIAETRAVAGRLALNEPHITGPLMVGFSLLKHSA